MWQVVEYTAGRNGLICTSSNVVLWNNSEVKCSTFWNYPQMDYDDETHLKLNPTL
jgi:hypothetical protein